MPIYIVRGPDGKTYDVEGPEGATAEELGAFISKEQTRAKPYDVASPIASAMNVGQAMTFGFSDEIAGIFGADKERYRATVDQFRKDYPAAATIGTVSGSMVIPGGAAKLVKQSPYLAAATMGLAQGALQGAGDAETLEQTPQRASLGGLTGMAVAPLLAFGLGTGGNVLSALGSKIKPSWADDVARRRIATAFERDSVDADAVGRRMVDIGPEARVADAAGENTRTALDLNATLPGKTQNNLESVIRNRQANQFSRMNAQVVDQVNGGYGRAGDVYEALTKQQSSAAAPLYAALDKMTVAPTESLVKTLSAASKLGAFGAARKSAIARMEKFSLNEPEVERLVKTSEDSLFNTITTRIQGGKPLEMRDLDLVKRGLDDMIEKETDAVTGKVTSLGRDYIGLRKSFINELDTATNGAYKAARNAFAGPASLKTAIDKGKRFWREEPVKLADEIEGMSESEVQAFRIGASEALRYKIGAERGRTELLGMWKDNNIKERMKALLGSDLKYSEIERRLANELQLKRLEQLGRGSQTAKRLLANDDQGLGVAADVADMGINKTGILTGLLNAVKNNAPRITTPEPVRDAMGRILLSQYQPAEMQALLRAQEIIRRQRALAGITSGVVSGKAGASGVGLLDD